jgi:C1A family cysteine protease/predicted secreted protein
MKAGWKRSLRLFSALWIVLVAALAPSSSALSGSPPSEPPPPVEITLGAEDNGHRVQIHEGEALVIRLESNPSTGYAWELAQPGLSAESIPVLWQTGDEYEAPQVLGSSSPEGPEAPQPLLGAPTTQILRFQAVRAGQASLKLVYRRPWEDVSPLDSFSLEVEAVGSFGDTPPATLEADETTSLPAAVDPAILGDDGQLGLPTSFNWCDQGACTPVKNQGGCGSCWAFSTVGPLESNIQYYDGVEKDLSEQYLLSCNTDGWDCTGGQFAHDYHEWKVPSGEPDAGAVYEAEFPYTARDDPCNPPHNHYEKIADWDYVGSPYSAPPVADIKQAILDHGPVSVAICSAGSAFHNYSGGIYEANECTGVDHAVVLVGWDNTQGTNGIWYLRNSWGTGWGEGGYMRIGYGINSVGYGANYVVYYPSCYQLDTEVNPAGAGNVVANPSPDCGVGGYEPDTTVYLTANPNPGWQFTVWSGDASGSTNPTSLTMDSNKSVTAHFVCDGCSLRTDFPLTLKTYEHEPSGWLTILSESFEGSFPGSWEVVDNRSGYGEYYWGRRACRAFTGNYSGWAVGGGVDGSSLDCGSSYPDYADSWMVYGPFSLEGATAAEMQFKLWLDSEAGYDYAFWGASTDGADFYGLGVSGYSSGWVDRLLDLSDLYQIGSVLGEPEVWIALAFQSDGYSHYPEGAYVDNVVVRKYVSATGQPAPSSEPAPCTTCGTDLDEQPAVMTRQR